MLINLRDNNEKLIIKDVLDIDFDMMVEKREDGMYHVAVNSKYDLDEVFPNEETAEEQMIFWANTRNLAENELRQY